MSTSVGFSRRRLGAKETFKSKYQEYKDLIYNDKERTIFQRSYSSFLKICAFYFVFYACLLIFCFVLGLFFMWVVVDANYPERRGMDNLMKGNPGMAFRPLPDLWNPLIRFEQGVRSTYKIYMDHLQTVVDQYDNDQQVGEHFVGCPDGKSSQYSDDDVCRFDLDFLGDECTWQKDYGYDMGQPCVLVKLNQQYGWNPTRYDADSMPDEIKEMGNTYGYDYMYVTCEGENPLDRENIGNITFYPSFGFPMWYYPYINQEGYRQPIVMIRFENPKNGVVISVYCKAWAANLHHHQHDQAASVRFDLLID